MQTGIELRNQYLVSQSILVWLVSSDLIQGFAVASSFEEESSH